MRDFSFRGITKPKQRSKASLPTLTKWACFPPIVTNLWRMLVSKAPWKHCTRTRRNWTLYLRTKSKLPTKTSKKPKRFPPTSTWHIANWCPRRTPSTSAQNATTTSNFSAPIWKKLWTMSASKLFGLPPTRFKATTFCWICTNPTTTKPSTMHFSICCAKNSYLWSKKWRKTPLQSLLGQTKLGQNPSKWSFANTFAMCCALTNLVVSWRKVPTHLQLALAPTTYASQTSTTRISSFPPSSR